MFVGEKFSQQYFGLNNNEDTSPIVKDDVSLVPILWGVIYCNPHLTLVVMEEDIYQKLKVAGIYEWLEDCLFKKYGNVVFKLLREKLFI